MVAEVERTKRRPSRRWWVIAAVALPLVFLVIFVAHYSVNVPFWDQWELVPLLQKYHHGTLTFGDLFAQHNEHRLFFPQLIMVLAAQATHWNTRAECAISVVIAACSFALIAVLVRQAGRDWSPRWRWLAPAVLIIASLAWFSPVQVENWLWGWQIQWFLNVLGAVAAACVLGRLGRRESGRMTIVELGLLLSAAGIAQYSLGNGTLLWPLAIVALLYVRAPRLHSGVVTVVGVGLTWLYYHKFGNPSTASQTLAKHHPLLLVHYVAIYLGRPLTFAHHGAAALGVLLTLLFFGLSGYFLLRRPTMFRHLLPWIMLGLYAICTAVITGFGRLDLGLNEAYSSRYITVSSLCLISTVVLAATFVAHKQTPFRSPKLSIFVYGALAVTALLIAANGAWGVHNGIEHHRQLLAMRACTHAAAPTQSCLLSTYPNAQIVAPRLQYLKTIHWAGY